MQREGKQFRIEIIWRQSNANTPITMGQCIAQTFHDMHSVALARVMPGVHTRRVAKGTYVDERIILRVVHEMIVENNLEVRGGDKKPRCYGRSAAAIERARRNGHISVQLARVIKLWVLHHRLGVMVILRQEVSMRRTLLLTKVQRRTLQRMLWKTLRWMLRRFRFDE